MKRHLLLVDADPQSRRILEVSLRKSGHVVTGVGDAAAALDRMAKAPADLVLSDTRLPGTDGFALVTAIRQRPAWSAVPIMFLSSDASVESKTRAVKQGVEEYLVKPIYIHEVVARVNLVLQRSERLQLERGDASEKTRFTGSLQQFGLVDAIRTMDKGRHSGVLHTVSGEERAVLFFRNGALIDAEAGALRDIDAVERALSWSDGTYEGEFREVRREDAIRKPIQTLLADSIRRIDDWSRLVEVLPPLDHVLDVDTAQLAERLGDVPDEANAILRSLDGRKSIRQAIEQGGADEIGRLRTIAKLWTDGLLMDRSDGGTHAGASTGASVAPGRGDADERSRKKRTTEDFEAPAGERKRTTLDYDEPVLSPAQDDDMQQTTPGTLAASELLAATTPGTMSAPKHDDDALDADDASDEPGQEDGTGARTSLTRMRRRRRRWKRLSLEGAPPPPVASTAPATKSVVPPATAVWNVPTDTAPTAGTPTATPQPSSTLLDMAQPRVSAAPPPGSTLPDVGPLRMSTAPPPLRSPFSLVPPAADMAARLEVARARRSLAPPAPVATAAAPTAPAQPQPAPTSAAQQPPVDAPRQSPAPAAPQPAAPVVQRPPVVAVPTIAAATAPATTTLPAIALPTTPTTGRMAANAPEGTFARAVTRPEELGRTRIAGSATTTLPSLAPPPAGSPPRTGPGPTTTPTPAWPEPSANIAPTGPNEPTVTTSPELPRARAHSSAAPASARRSEPPDRQSAWDIPQDEEPITIPPATSSRHVLAWSALAGVALMATAFVVRLASSDGDGGSQRGVPGASAVAAPSRPPMPPAIESPPIPAEPVPAEPAAPVAPTPTNEAMPTQAPTEAIAPPAAEAAPSVAEPAAAPAAPDAAAQRDQLVEQARALEAKGKPVKALLLYEQAVQLDPNASALLSHVALAYLNAGRNKDALDRAERAVKADATNSEGWIVVGAARDGLNDHKGAREAYRQCSEVGTGAYVIECKRMLR